MRVKQYQGEIMDKTSMMANRNRDELDYLTKRVDKLSGMPGCAVIEGGASIKVDISAAAAIVCGTGTFAAGTTSHAVSGANIIPLAGGAINLSTTANVKAAIVGKFVIIN